MIPTEAKRPPTGPWCPHGGSSPGAWRLL